MLNNREELNKTIEELSEKIEQGNPKQDPDDKSETTKKEPNTQQTKKD